MAAIPEAAPGAAVDTGGAWLGGWRIVEMIQKDDATVSIIAVDATIPVVAAHGVVHGGSIQAAFDLPHEDALLLEPGDIVCLDLRHDLTPLFGAMQYHVATPHATQQQVQPAIYATDMRRKDEVGKISNLKVWTDARCRPDLEAAAGDERDADQRDPQAEWEDGNV